MSTTLMKTPDRISTWTSVFPAEQATQQQSLIFIKKLLAIAISNITYVRAIFPEFVYADRSLDDLQLKILKDDKNCPSACQVIKWVKGCFDAVEKNYLRQLIIGVYKNVDDPETLVESYTFRFCYTTNTSLTIFRNDAEMHKSNSTSETKKATVSLLRTILLLAQSLNPLPENAFMTMKLLYYDDITPHDYEPPGFKPALSETFNYEFEPMSIKIGDVSTPFHQLKVRVKTDQRQFELVGDGTAEDFKTNTSTTSNALNVREDDKAMDSQKTDIYINSNENSGFSSQTFDYNDSTMRKKVELKALAENGTDGEQDGEKDKEHSTVRCPCGLNEDDGLMIFCPICCTWQHAICFKILSEDDTPSSHICEKCAKEKKQNENHLPPTDPYLLTLSPLTVQATCLWRRTLQAALEFSRIRPAILMRRLEIAAPVAEGLLTRLEKEGYVKATGKGKKVTYTVMKDYIEKHAFPKYLSFKQLVKQNANDENKENLTTSDTTKKKNIGFTEIDKLSKQTASLNVEDGNTINSGNGSSADFQGHVTRNRKRINSVVDKSQEFEFSDSQQDTSFCTNEIPAKKAKASIVVDTVAV